MEGGIADMVSSKAEPKRRKEGLCGRRKESRQRGTRGKAKVLRGAQCGEVTEFKCWTQ